MSRGNINYKYLRRRKNWFQRNWSILLIIGIIVIIISIAGALVAFNYSAIKDKLFGVKEEQTTETESAGKQENEKEIVWTELKETKDEVQQSYVVPEGVTHPYLISINRAANCITIYGIDKNGEYTIPVKAFVCSCGKQGEETQTGDAFVTSNQYMWGIMDNNLYAKYTYRFNGPYVLSSVTYTNAVDNAINTAEYNLLGTAADTHGSVRLTVGDMKWIYTNCPVGTTVRVYDDAANPGPLGKPSAIKLPAGSEFAGWDPTDMSEGNPWASRKAELTGVKDITVNVGDSVNFMSGVSAKDTCGNDITGLVNVSGKYTTDIAGEYTIKYKVKDAIGSSAEKSIKLTVK